MTSRTAIGIGLVLAGMFLAGGCAQKAPPPPPPPPPLIPAGRVAQLQKLNQEVPQFLQTIGALPGADAQNHQLLMARSLDELQKVLRLMQGSRQTGAFSVALETIDTAQSQLTSLDGRPEEAVVDSALEAAHDALQDLAQRDFPGNPTLTRESQQIQAHIDILQKERGAMHRLDTSAAMAAIGDMVRTLNDLYETGYH